MTEEVFTDCTDEELNIQYKTLRGITKYSSKSGNYCIKKIKIKNILDCFLRGIIIIPNYQRDLDKIKIEEMTITYEKDEESFNFIGNPIQLVIMNDYNKYILVDGQHRLTMFKILYKSNKITNQEILINIITCNDENEIYNMYKNFNYDISSSLKSNTDNFKNKVHIDIENVVKKLKYEKLKDYLITNYKKFFSKNNELIYSIDEFVEKLYESEFLEAFDNFNNAIKFLIDTNNIYCDNFYIDNDVITDIKLSKDELYNIKNKIIISLKNNNFIDLLIDDNIKENEFECIHIWIYKKKKHSVSGIYKNK